MDICGHFYLQTSTHITIIYCVIVNIHGTSKSVCSITTVILGSVTVFVVGFKLL